MLTDKTLNRLREILVEDEGLHLKKYKCSKGIFTTGCGFAESFGFPNAIKTITGVNSFDELEVLTEKQAFEILDYQLRYFEGQLNNEFNWYKYKSQPTKLVMLSLVFNVGLSTLKKFKNTLNALERDDMMDATKELWDSNLLGDIKGRAIKNGLMLLTQDINIEKDDTDNLYKILKKRVV